VRGSTSSLRRRVRAAEGSPRTGPGGLRPSFSPVRPHASRGVPPRPRSRRRAASATCRPMPEATFFRRSRLRSQWCVAVVLSFLSRSGGVRNNVPCLFRSWSVTAGCECRRVRRPCITLDRAPSPFSNGPHSRLREAFSGCARPLAPWPSDRLRKRPSGSASAYCAANADCGIQQRSSRITVQDSQLNVPSLWR
jgi:hypothetical protein